MASTKRLRNKYGITQKELALFTTIPIRTIQNWEYRDNMPDYMEVVIDLAIYSLNKIVDYRMEEEYPDVIGFGDEYDEISNKLFGEEIKNQVEIIEMYEHTEIRRTAPVLTL